MAILVLDGWVPTVGAMYYAPWIVVVPETASASSVNFTCLAGLHGYIVAQSVHRVDELAHQAILFEPKCLWGWAEGSKTFLAYTRRST